MQPRRLSPRTPALMNPSTEANAKMYISPAASINPKCPEEAVGVEMEEKENLTDRPQRK